MKKLFIFTLCLIVFVALVPDQTQGRSKAEEGLDKEAAQVDAIIPNGVIRVFTEKEFNGEVKNFAVPVNDCFVVPSPWRNQISSFDTGPSCFILWESPNCEGNRVRFEEYTYGSRDLTLVGLDNHVRSISRCCSTTCK